MKKILVLGAGLSSSWLIKYLLEHSAEENWEITVADANPALAEEKVKGHQRSHILALDISQHDQLSDVISNHHLVVSMLPASMHPAVARQCVSHKKHLVTASYVSGEMKSLHPEALKAGILLLNETGLDPGIDHLSAMKIIHQIKEKGGTILSFKSSCGGLVAPEYDDNPWHYKFTWNPRNVVLAGQSAARFLDNGELKFIPPSRIFSQTDLIEITGYGEYECYANRDSLDYIDHYGIQSAETVFRGTIRGKGFCDAWNMLVKLGLNDDSFTVHNSSALTYRELLSAFTPGHKNELLENKVSNFLGIDQLDESFLKLKWLGLFEDTKIETEEGTPARIIQNLLEEKWKLNQGDLDLVIMHHLLKYSVGKEMHEVTSSLVVKGEDDRYTAMSKTVGLPMAIAVKLILAGEIKARGVQIPITKEFYKPILEELDRYGIRFTEEHLDN